ncbi:MAG: dephospho-CoA kinase [Acidobacteriota bacterium]
MPDHPLLEVGLTGGIASGKSTVDAMLEAQGASIIDADAVVHTLLEAGQPEYDAVVRRFGKGILSPAGAVDRKALAAIIFDDARAREDLNALLHPGVEREEARIQARLRRTGGGVVVTDAALLVETGRNRHYHRLVVVACDPSLQLARLLAREPGMTVAAAHARIASQATLASRLAVADYVIWTHGSLTETEKQTREVYLHLIEDLQALCRGEPLPRREQKEEEG